MTGWADIKVFCPIAVYPDVKGMTPRSYRYQKTDLHYSPPDLNTHYFEYPALPVITRPINGWLCRRKLLPLLQGFKPDLLLNYWLYPEGYAAVRSGHALGRPVIVRSIGSDIRRIPDGITRYFTRKTLALADYVLTASTDLATRAIALGASPDRCRAILNGCDIDTFHPRDQQKTRRTLGLESDAEIVLYVGSLLGTKGLFDLIEASKTLAACRPKLKFYCVGSGPAQGALEKAAAEAGLVERWIFVGRKSSQEVAEWMCAANLFCLPSHSEGCPNVIIEAIASGRAVVATDVGGVAELVDQACAILVPAHQPRALADALKRALSMPWDETLIARKYQRSWETVAADMVDVCEWVLAHRTMMPV
jgi:glycosyltransferase involved in cell wall biosynthesis